MPSLGRVMTTKSDYEEEEKDEVMSLTGTHKEAFAQKRKAPVEIIVKDEPELFSRITMRGESKDDENPPLLKKGTSR
jgi:hypothetical protein